MIYRALLFTCSLLVPVLSAQADWLKETTPKYPARVVESDRAWVLDNGLVRRELSKALLGTTASLADRRTQAEHLRALRPVARVVVDGVEAVAGGPAPELFDADQAFLPDESSWKVDPASLHLVETRIEVPNERFAWKRVRHASPLVNWPSKGVSLVFVYAPTKAHADLPQGLRVVVYHELYDHVPVLAKRVEVLNVGDTAFVVDRVVTEELAIAPDTSWVEARDGVPLPAPEGIHAESEYGMGGMSPLNGNRFGVRWMTDERFATQVNYLRRTPCLLEIAPEEQMRVALAPGEELGAPMGFLALFDSSDQTRRSLTLARFYETVAPWTTENPLMMHVRHADDATVTNAIEQASAVGFEMLILTFGSGFDIEDRSPENLARWKRFRELAHESGVELGGYTLLSSRRIEPSGDMCVNPMTGALEGMTHGVCPSSTSAWGRRYFETLQAFLDETGFDLIEHDGPYPGDRDATARPPFQEGAHDSRFKQWTMSADLYRWCRANGVYVNAPDWYFLVGTSKTGMGYRETNWSLPRANQALHARLNIFDGTRFKRPSMGWMFVPLTEYHGGGARATVEPLSEHLDHYATMLASNLGAGVQACYRGPRLYDADETREAVTRWVRWYKRHRDVLEAPIIHAESRRPDGRSPDWVLHADPRLDGHKAMLVVYRPNEDLSRDCPFELEVDLSWAGKSTLAAFDTHIPAGDPAWFYVW